jgi:crotonobetaine/carnitine-CoA ligase
VLECAAIGVPSELEDEDVKLAVVLRPGSSLGHQQLLDFCLERLPKFMVPRYLEFVDALPRTPTDKVAKFKLRAQGDHGLTANTWDRESTPAVTPAPVEPAPTPPAAETTAN